MFSTLGISCISLCRIDCKVRDCGDDVGILATFSRVLRLLSRPFTGRMGTRDDLRNLIKACRSVGVRVYADAVINHMSGGGNDMALHRRQDGSSCTTWGNKSSSLASCVPPYTAGS